MAHLKAVQVSFTRREWNIVTNLHQSNEVSDLKHAVALIVSWKARSGDSVPLAADITEMLLRAIIMDKETKCDDWFGIGNIKLAYCTAIIRFVNYVNEIYQSNRAFKSIVTAGYVGIPQWVVDIRHSATHSHLPSLENLRQAASYCRNWLWDHHWSRPTDETIGFNSNSQNENDENQLQKEAIDLIDRFIYCSLQMMSSSTGRKKDKENANMRLLKILTKMEMFIMKHPWEFLEVFLKEGYLILNEKQIKSDLLAENGDSWTIPADLQLFWRPVFHYLNEAKMLSELLFQSRYCSSVRSSSMGDCCKIQNLQRDLIISKNKLLETLSGNEVQPTRKGQLIAWSDRMLTAYVKSNVLTQSDWERILKMIILGPEKLREAYFDKVLMKIEEITKKEKHTLRQLAIPSSKKTIISETLTSNASSDIVTSFKTIKNSRNLTMQKGNEKQSKTRDASNASSNNHRWSICNPVEWKDVPLGLTPEQSAESLYLVVEPK